MLVDHGGSGKECECSVMHNENQVTGQSKCRIVNKTRSTQSLTIKIYTHMRAMVTIKMQVTDFKTVENCAHGS